MALCHVTELTNQNLQKTIAVMNDSQLSKDFDGLYHAKDIHLFALSPRAGAYYFSHLLKAYPSY